ncbi:futalosine hydrolase [Geomonas silvestris]|uniref:Futalosine hydrolase n=1 Tax=Geomonas silvestris TaxID=2740184 RepID=A0A6V8MJH3_9BACT|nr:futalosine hydrolase [Geomonas silvestris]GFO59829.1 futalosine hydrolase [Geomonas silvestris]
MKPIVLTASTDMELAVLVERLGAAPLHGLGHLKAWRSALEAGEVILAVTGIGKVNAACAATLLLERLAPRLLINTGCGGAIAGSGLEVGDLALASSECFPEEGVQTPQGWRGLDLIGIPTAVRGERAIFNEVPLDAALARQALQFAGEQGFRAVLGPFHTVSTCSGTAERGMELAARYPGICENMEGAALAQVAFIYDTPFLEVRGISNLVEDRDLSRWNLKLAVTEAQNFLIKFLQFSGFPS